MIHLDVKSDYSFRKAYGSPEQIIRRASEVGASAVCIADSGSTWGHIPFWLESQKSDIKPIFGVELSVTDALNDKNVYDTVVLIARTNSELTEMYELVTLATQQFYYVPRITWKQLDGFPGVKIYKRVAPTNWQFAKSIDNAYIAATPEPGFLLAKAVKEELPCVACVSPLYPQAEDQETCEMVIASGTASKTGEVQLPNRWMMSRSELETRFGIYNIGSKQLDKWLANNEAIAASCVAAPEKGENVRPGISKTIEEWCLEGAEKRGIDLTVEPYKSRYEREVAMIHEKGFTDYFLMIGDLVQWAKSRMLVGPARGSSAGSLVCYLMEIVEVDPLEYDLLFERFIDVNREDLPDIDIDFPDDMRDLVFSYIVERYGADRVARIGTISAYKPRSALNDVARCYSIPSWEVKKLTEVMVERSGGDARANMAIEDTIHQFEAGRDLVDKYPKIKMATKIEGHPRHTGKHAAGILVSDLPVTNYCAINRRDGEYIGMLTKEGAESLGLLKIDALGLTTLSVITDCCNQVGIDPRHLYEIPTNIPEVFEIFQADRVAGIFQFEGYAVRSLMRQMGVEEFNDIVALTALARPGPLHCGAANEFIGRRTDSVDWEYALPDLIPHTKHTYGTIVYQEQVMSITRDLGDMSWQDVSALRKAMSKSLGEEFFNTYRDKFLIGTHKRGIDDKSALALWNDMCTFGSWAFNLSHAVSYALISYWCAYLKWKYPLEFTIAQLKRTSDADHTLRLLRESLKEGIEIVPFDYQKSEESWAVKDGKIYGGFLAVKGVGPVMAERLLNARREDPDGWISKLTVAQRGKILAPNNTPWHNLNRISKAYKKMYEDPENLGEIEFLNGKTYKGVRRGYKIQKLEDITEVRGKYYFIGTLKQRNLRDLNETQSLAKRGGQEIKTNNLFLNLTFEDDTSSILATVDRWLYEAWGYRLMEEAADGLDFLVAGEILYDGRRKIYIKNMARLS